MNGIIRAALRFGGRSAYFGLLTIHVGVHAAGSAAAVAPPQKMQSPVRAVLPVFAGTVPVRVPARRFENEWSRARLSASAIPEMRKLVSAAVGVPRFQQIAYIQSAVHQRIGWRSDATQYGRHDYWASAEETLRSGRGDMEDRAILKMQALRALGFSTRDLFLTLGRDTVGGPQAVLVVRVGDTFYLLDDTGGPPYTPGERPEFTPAFTFGWGNSWVHMPRHNARAVAVAASDDKGGPNAGAQ